MKKLKIYLDICCFNRPFDNQEFIKIKVETEAKLFIQSEIKKNNLELVWSYILDKENSVNPFDEKKNQINEWKKIASFDIIETKEIIDLAIKFCDKYKMRSKDALHLSCAIISKCDYFITTDYFLIKKAELISEIKITLPTIFIELEDFYDK